MKKLIVLVILLSISTILYPAQDIIPEPAKDEQVSVPTINDEIRKVYSEISTTNTDIDALDTRIDELEAIPAVSSEKLVKAWINFNGTGTIAINDSYNVAGIVDNDTGDYTVTWDTDFANDDYAVVGMAEEDVGIGWVFVTGKTTGRAVGSVQIAVISDAGAQKDSAVISVIAVGDQ